MGYRDDREALRQQKEALEREVEDLREALDRERDAREEDASGEDGAAEVSRRTPLLAPLSLAVLATAAAWLEGGPVLGAALVVAVLVPLLVVLTVRRLLVVAAPHELLVVTGATERRPDGSVRGWKLARGRVVRVPMVQQVARLDLRAIPLVIRLEGAHAASGGVVDATLHAIVRIHGDPALAENAVERYLGQHHDQVALAARQTLEGVAREVVAQLTVEQLALERATAAHELAREAEAELDKLGLALVGLWIGEVSDRGGVLRESAARQLASVEARAEAATGRGVGR